MSPTTRSRLARCFGALLCAAALLPALPAPAFAERRDERRHHDDHWDRGRGHAHDRGRGHDRDRGHAYGFGHARGRHPAHHAPYYRPAPAHWHRGHRHYAPAYYCGRCRSHFASYEGLCGHVHAHHHVPTWRVPGLLAQVSFGFAFGL